MKYKSILLDSSFPILYKLLIDYLPINIFILDSEGYLVWGNSRMVKTLNETEDSFIGKHISYWGEDKWKACKKVLKDGNEQIIEEIGVDQKIYLTNRIPVKEKLDNNLIQGVIGISLDITKQKQAEIAKQEFLMNMAHDLRTPLSGIIALSNIQSKEGTNAEDRLCSQWIEDAGEQLLELLNSVLEVTAAEQHMKSLASDTIDFRQFAKELQH